jgi:hypothetical protein
MSSNPSSRSLGWIWSPKFHIGTLVGFVLIAVGAVLPWVELTSPAKLYVLGMESGVERVWVRRLLAVAGVGVVVDSLRFVVPDERQAFDVILVGIGAVVTVLTIIASPLGQEIAVPASGVSVTLLGSLLVVLTAGGSLFVDSS